jgi:hypothetical protein
VRLSSAQAGTGKVYDEYGKLMVSWFGRRSRVWVARVSAVGHLRVQAPIHCFAWLSFERFATTLLCVVFRFLRYASRL